jgi:hypothetical protein
VFSALTFDFVLFVLNAAPRGKSFEESETALTDPAAFT